MRKIRKRLGLTQEEVARRAGISIYTYMKVENGNEPKGLTLFNISRALNERPYRLFYIEETKAI